MGATTAQLWLQEHDGAGMSHMCSPEGLVHIPALLCPKEPKERSCVAESK